MRPVGLKWGTDPVFERVPQIASLSANAKHLTQMPHILPGNDGCEVPDAGTGSSYIVRPAMPEPVGEDLGGNAADMRLGTSKNLHHRPFVGEPRDDAVIDIGIALVETLPARGRPEPGRPPAALRQI